MAYDSEVDICNLALGWLGANPIESLSDDSTEARLCNTNYDNCRDTTLEARNWTFATTRRELPRSPDAPDFEYSHKFLLPSDCMRVMQASDDPEFRDFTLDWVREEDYVLSNYTHMYIRYIMRIEDITKFSATFINAMAAQIAVALAIPITSKTALMDAFMKKYDYFVDIAGGNDGVQGKNEVLRNDRLIKVR